MQPLSAYDPAKRPRLSQATPGAGAAPPMSTPLALRGGTPGPMLATALRGQDDRLPGTLDSASRAAPPTGDVLDYLRGRVGKIKDLEDEVAGYRSRCDRLQAEAAALQEDNTRLRSENQVLKLSAASRTGPAAASEQLSKLLDDELRRALQLEQDLGTARQKEAAAVQRAAALEASAGEMKAEHARMLGAAQQEASALRAQLQQREAESSAAISDAQLTAKLERRKRETQEDIQRVAMQQLQEVQQLSAALQEQLQGSQQRAAQAQAEVAALQSSAVHVRLQLLEEDLQQAKRALAAARQASHVPAAAAAPPTAVTGAGSAGAAAADTALAANTPVASADPAAMSRAWERLAQVVARHGAVLPAAATPDAVGAAAAELVEHTRDLTRALAERDESITQLRTVASKAESYAKEVQSQLQEAQARLQQALTAERVMGHKAEALAQERDKLRSALAAPPSIDNPASYSGRLLVGQQAIALEQLQALNAQLQEQVAALQRERASHTTGLEMQTLACRAGTKRAEAAEAKVAQLTRECDSLAAEVAALQERLGRGEMSRAAGVRVLHLRHNPEADAQRAKKEVELMQLQAENEALKTQLAELEVNAAAAAAALAAAQSPGGPAAREPLTSPPSAAAAAAGSTVGPLPGPAMGSGVATAVKDAEILVLRRQLSEADKAMARLKAVFKERITVFREACYSLFGYRVDMTAEATAAADAAEARTTFALKPQHADDPGAILVFRSTGSGASMELVPNAYTSGRMAREVNTFITKFNSIPAFTANLTMENFQKQTQC